MQGPVTANERAIDADMVAALADETGQPLPVVRRVYDREFARLRADARIPDYLVMDPLELHLAFDSGDPDADRDALVEAGATALSDARLPDGSRLLMLRDPWGLALQLCARATPLL